MGDLLAREIMDPTKDWKELFDDSMVCYVSWFSITTFQKYLQAYYLFMLGTDNYIPVNRIQFNLTNSAYIHSNIQVFYPKTV